MLRNKIALRENAKTFFGKFTLSPSIEMMERSLRSPTDVECRNATMSCPVPNVLKFLPIAHLFKEHLLQRSPSDDEPINTRQLLFATTTRKRILRSLSHRGSKIHIMRIHISLRRSFVLLMRNFQQHQIDI